MKGLLRILSGHKTPKLTGDKSTATQRGPNKKKWVQQKENQVNEHFTEMQLKVDEKSEYKILEVRSM